MGERLAGSSAAPCDVTRVGSSYAHGTGLVPLLGACIGEVLDAATLSYPDQPALISCHQGLRFTYSQLRARTELFARGLLRLGIQKGDRVGVWATNCVEWVIAQLGTAKIGAILVNINPAYRSYELEFALVQSECQTLIMVSGFRDCDYIATIFGICPEAERSAPGKLFSEKLPFLKNLVVIGEPSRGALLGWDDLVAMGDDVDVSELRAREHTLSFDDPINIQYTSGTTGRPKGALLSHHNIVNNALVVDECLHLTHRDRICIPVPFYHCFGMVMGNMGAVVKGAAIIIPAKHFDPLMTLQAVANEKCTTLFGVPTMFLAELEHPEFSRFDLRSLRTGIMAGAPCPIQLMKRVVEQMHCPEMTIAYGQTEASPAITQTHTDDPIELRVTTVGKPLPHTEVKIVDPLTGRIVPHGIQGELCTRGYCVMKRYYKNDEATKNAIDEDHWLHTGDIAVMDENGYCKIAGRVKDMIIRGGENIYPREIEEFLYTCPGVSEVQVIGVPDVKYGEDVAAWVKPKSDAAICAEDIRQFCKGKIAEFKIPRYIKIVDQFPMTVTGKIQKFKMRQSFIEELGLQEAAKIETA